MVRMGAALALAAACSAASAGQAPLDCDKVGDMASTMIQQRAAGLTERDALASLSERGEYQMGFVVDAVFRAKPDAIAAVTRAEIVQTCHKVNRDGATY